MGPRKNSEEHRPPSPAELVVALRDSIETLALHCDRFTRRIQSATGEPPDLTGPTADLSAQLRKLWTRATGDNLIQRVCDAHGAAIPTMAVSADAALPEPRWDTVPYHYLSVGAVPDDGDVEVSILDVRRRTCLVVIDAGGAPIVQAWENLVRDMANMVGVHVGEERPVVWDVIGQYQLGPVPPLSLLVDRMGRAIARAGNAVLTDLGAAPVDMFGPPSSPIAHHWASISESRPRPGPAPTRNGVCPCGSGRKFKHCRCAGR